MMVMHLPMPEFDKLNFIDIIVSERNHPNRAIFDVLKDGWNECVLNYLEKRGNPEVLKPWPRISKHQTMFLTLYNNPSPNSHHRPILENLRSRSLQLCPACGEDGTPNTLDHYLPKDNYPEFSILPINLSPMCDICQGKKGNKSINGLNERIFIHPYFDEFTTVQILTLVFSIPFNSPSSICILPHPNLNSVQSELVGRHIKGLGIDARFFPFFKNEYIRLLKNVKRIRERNGNVRDHLNYFIEYAKDKSINSWGHVFYSAVLADDELVLHLQSGDLPEY